MAAMILWNDIVGRRKATLAAEFTLFFVVLPLALYSNATRWNVHASLWIVSIYSIIILHHASGFTWRELWQGIGWSKQQKQMALIRFCVSTACIFMLAEDLVPERILSFPMQRPWFWLLVMVLYPILSVLPQELMFRSFFFRRYETLFPQPVLMVAISALSFGFVHIVFHNWVSPTLCFIAGLMFAHSYRQHRSLKWATIEHAAYGCMVFTIGIGFYFFVGGLRH